MAHTLRHSASVVVPADPGTIYDLVSDITRTGEWSPQCRGCTWDDPADAGRAGAMFTGHNETPDRQWDTRCQVVVADRPREFAWEVGPGRVRWGYALEAVDGGTRLTESWHFLEDGLAFFRDRFGESADTEIGIRSRAALEGIPRTLDAVARIAGSTEPGRG